MSDSRRRPDFFIVGAPKCGTSSLYAYLGRHPDIYVSPKKEPRFFGSDHHRINHRGSLSFDEYLALFSGAADAERVGEASVNYLYSRYAAREIKAFNPQARIVAMVRDPVEVMHACHGTNVAAGAEPIRDFASALALEEERKKGRLLPNRPALRQNLYYRDIVAYASHLERYFAVFGRDRVFVIVYDDFAADTARVYRETLEFLDVDPSFVPQFEIVNPSKQVRSARAHDFVFEPPASLQRLARRLLPDRLRNRLRYRLVALNRREAPRNPIPPDFAAELRSELEPEIEGLSVLLGRDFSPWLHGQRLRATSRPKRALSVVPVSGGDKKVGSAGGAG